MKSIKDWTLLPGIQKKRPGGAFEEMEPPPPAEIRRMSAERMRDVGRALMIAGSKPPRQQMVEIGKSFDTLLDQLDLLADQPGREALKRRILLNLRPKVMGR